MEDNIVSRLRPHNAMIIPPKNVPKSRFQDLTDPGAILLVVFVGLYTQCFETIPAQLLHLPNPVSLALALLFLEMRVVEVAQTVRVFKVKPSPLIPTTPKMGRFHLRENTINPANLAPVTVSLSDDPRKQSVFPAWWLLL
jgi:hypothetical protein